MEETRKVMAAVRSKLIELELTEVRAARRIGVTAATLGRHLAGAYVRSDSLAKYRRWLNGTEDAATNTTRSGNPVADTQDEAARARPDIDPLHPPRTKPKTPFRVVDLFGGCGGLSLGFELADDGALFDTVLAIDIEEAMVRVFNANHPPQSKDHPLGRQADLSEFLNEAEVLAFYLDHRAGVNEDSSLAAELDGIAPMGLASLVAAIRKLDDNFVETLASIRSSPSFSDTYGSIAKTSLSQTSVLGFHAALKLPRPGTGSPRFDPPLWGRNHRSASASSPGVDDIPADLLRQCGTTAAELWEQEIAKLRERAGGSGSGQLASAAKKIHESLVLLDGPAYRNIRAAWLEWRTHRDALRRHYFEDARVLAALRRIYRSGHEVHVLAGGPPCQGFSRIGRGKIRSLREQSVHVQSDAKAGDSRNELMLQYVLFVAALSPAAFLFENVKHFKAEVTTLDGTFNATDILAEAITDISQDGLEYAVSSRIVVGSEHLVPQTRERFFMVGIRRDVMEASRRPTAAAWCLSLPIRSAIPLKDALTGLPEPVYASAKSHRAGGTATLLPVNEPRVSAQGAAGEYLRWIRQPNPRHPGKSIVRIDAHCARDSRADDRAFFALLGPGKRWMDYRCDENPLVRDLAQLVEWAMESQPRNGVAGLSEARLRQLREALDGSLSLRLLLDRIPLAPGEVRHHLCAPNYLKKRDGSHGDWLARLDPEAPSKTMVSHMGKDTYAYVHPSEPRTLSVREAARVQTFPDWYAFGSVGLVDGYRVIGNAVPPLLGSQLALRVASVLTDGGIISGESTKLSDSTPAGQSLQLHFGI